MVRTIFSLFLLLHASAIPNTIYIYTLANWWGDLFNVQCPYLNGDNQREPFYQLKQALEEKNFVVKQIETLENLENIIYLIAFNIPCNQLELLKKCCPLKKILFLWEPPSTLPHEYDLIYHHYFDKVYTFNDILVDNQLYYKFYYPVLKSMIPELIDFKNKKLCTMVCCNKKSNHPDELYTARLNFINFFETNHISDFEFYGRGWDSISQCYKGTLTHKLPILKNYKFCICFENIKNIPGYITEKIFDCFRAGCVPIYWGANNIEDYIPSNCFIDRRNFNTEEDIYQHIKEMNESTYQDYIENIKNFLASDSAQLFSIENFVQTICSSIDAILH